MGRSTCQVIGLRPAGRREEGFKARRPSPRRITAAALAVCLAVSAAAAAQEPPEPKAPAEPKRIDVLQDRDPTQDAQRTREQLQDLLGRLPPSVSQVLKADPTLLSNMEYMAPYPELVSFLGRHPEVSRDARFFVGDAEVIWRNRDPRDAMQRLWESLFSALIPFGIFLVVSGSVLWLLKTALDHRRWHRLVNRQTEIHNKLLDRFASHEDLLAFMQSPAGQRFLQMAATPDTGPFTLAAMPVGRILLAVQLGLVLLAGGVGMQFVGSRLDEVWEPFYVFGVLAIALGAGFILSASASYVLSNRLGLFDALRPGTARGESGE